MWTGAPETPQTGAPETPQTRSHTLASLKHQPSNDLPHCHSSSVMLKIVELVYGWFQLHQWTYCIYIYQVTCQTINKLKNV